MSTKTSPMHTHPLSRGIVSYICRQARAQDRDSPNYECFAIYLSLCLVVVPTWRMVLGGVGGGKALHTENPREARKKVVFVHPIPI